MAVFVATIVFPTFQVAVPSRTASPEESVPEKLYEITALSFSVTTSGVFVIYSIFKLLLVAPPPPEPPTIVNLVFADFTSLSFPSFSFS